MTTAFQSNAFQSVAFQEHGGVTSGAITGGLSYTNNNDTFAGTANLGVIAVPEERPAGGWPERGVKWLPGTRRRHVPEPETVEAIDETVLARLAQERQTFVARLALAKEERRSRAITEQLRAIYAEQDILTLGLEIAQNQIQDQEEEELLLLLAS